MISNRGVDCVGMKSSGPILFGYMVQVFGFLHNVMEVFTQQLTNTNKTVSLFVSCLARVGKDGD